MRVKIIVGTDYADLQKLIVIVEYEEKKVVSRCCDCQFYDASGDYRGAWGLCHRKGIRTKFTDEKCECYMDIRV